MENLLVGFGNVLQIKYLLLILAGVAGGISIGSLPGLTATMGVALLLPVTFGMEATSGFLMLIGIYVGAVYGGSVAAILVRTPGTPAAAATVFDGNEFSKRGEGGRAIGISTTSSAIGGLISALMLIFVSPYLAEFALKFSSAEYFALAFFGLTIIASISAKSLAKGLAVGMVGLLISTIGLDPMTGYSRFTFGSYYLFSGFSLIPVMIGLFAMPQIYTSVLEGVSQIHIKQKVTSILPTKADLKLMLPTAIRSGFLGTLIGSIPGAGADIAAFTAYNEAKRWSKHPEKFGTGIVEGVAAPEAANNGVTGGALIPLLTLGVPGDAVAAILLGALTLQGLQPGPILFRDHIDLVYTIFAGVMVANVFMFILGILGIRLFTKIVSIPKYYLMPIIFILCIVGSYAINNSFFDVLVMMGFGIVGYFMQKVEMSGSPIVLAMILGPMAEENLRKALVISEGSPSIFLTSPISLFFLVAAVGTIVWPIVKNFKNQKLQ